MSSHSVQRSEKDIESADRMIISAALNEDHGVESTVHEAGKSSGEAARCPMEINGSGDATESGRGESGLPELSQRSSSSKFKQSLPSSPGGNNTKQVKKQKQHEAKGGGVGTALSESDDVENSIDGSQQPGRDKRARSKSSAHSAASDSSTGVTLWTQAQLVRSSINLREAEGRLELTKQSDFASAIAKGGGSKSRYQGATSIEQSILVFVSDSSNDAVFIVTLIIRGIAQ